MRFSIIAAAAAALMALAGCVATPSVTAQEAVGPDPSPIVATRYRLDYGGRPTVRATVGDAGPFDFVVDTAASQTAVFSNIEGRLGARLRRLDGEGARVFSLSGLRTRPLVDLPSVSFGAVARPPGPAVQFDDWELQDRTPQGLLGLDVLSGYVALFDVERETFSLYAPDATPNFAAKGWKAVRLRRWNFGVSGAPLYTFEARFSRQRKSNRVTPLVLDTGSEVSLANPPLVERLLGTRSYIDRRAQATRFTDALDFSEDIFRLSYPSVLAGEVRWGEGVIYGADAQIFRDLGYTGRPLGIAGFELLGRRSFAIDFDRGLLFVSPPMRDRGSDGGGASPAADRFINGDSGAWPE